MFIFLTYFYFFSSRKILTWLVTKGITIRYKARSPNQACVCDSCMLTFIMAAIEVQIYLKLPRRKDKKTTGHML